MENAKKKRINALDVLIALLIVAMIAAFFFRGQILSVFEEEETEVVTFSFCLTDIEKEHAAYLKENCTLYNGSGTAIGRLLILESADACDERVLDSGETVQVKNGGVDLTGTVTAEGYTAGEFVYLADGTLLIPGGTVTVSTGNAVYTLSITSAEATPENRAN